MMLMASEVVCNRVGLYKDMLLSAAYGMWNGIAALYNGLLLLVVCKQTSDKLL